MATYPVLRPPDDYQQPDLGYRIIGCVQNTDKVTTGTREDDGYLGTQAYDFQTDNMSTALSTMLLQSDSSCVAQN